MGPTNGIGNSTFKNPTIEQRQGLEKIAAKKVASTGATEGLKEFKPTPTFKDRVCQFFGRIASFFRNLGSAGKTTETPPTPVNTATPRPPISNSANTTVSTVNTVDKTPPNVRPDMAQLAADITAPIMTLVSQTGLADKSFEELQTMQTNLKEARQACSPKNLETLAKTHKLTKEECLFLKEQIDSTREPINAFRSELATQAPKTMMREVVDKPLSELQNIKTSRAQADLKAMGCSAADQEQVSTGIDGLKHMAKGLGSTASGISLPGTRYTGSASAVSAKLYADIPKDTRMALANLYSDGYLAADKETTRFFSQAGVHMQFFPVAELATNIAKGDYDTLMSIQRPPISSDKLQVKFHTFETMPLNLALNGAPSTEGKSRVLVQHGLQSTLDKLANSMTLKGKDGHDVKINTTAFKFDARTVSSLLKCAKPEDKKQFDLLFASAMVLQHKLDTNSPINGPVSPEFASELNDVLGFTDSQEILSLVDKGFESQSAVNNALSFMTSFAERLGNRDDIQKTMMDLVVSPMDAVTQFEATVFQSALNIGGVDTNQASAMLQGTLAKGSATVGGVDILQAAKRGRFEKLTDLTHTAGTAIFDARKGIHNQEDRLNRLNYDTAKLNDVLTTIQNCDSQLSQIDTELSTLPTTPLPKGIEIQHVRHVVNADLAKQDVTTLTSGTAFSAVTADMPAVSPDVLSEKLTFATMPTSNMFGRQSVYNFKQDDMPSVIKTEVKDGKTFLALYEHQPGTSGDSGKLLGYLDPTRDKGFIDSYVKNANASITHADKASHSATVRSMMTEPNAKESVIRKDVLTDAKTAITEEKTSAVKEQSKREAKISTLTSTESTAFRSDQKAVRVAIAAYVREQLATVTRPEMTEKMDEIVSALHSDPAALSAIASKLVSVDAKRVGALIQTEARSFKGPESFQDWQKSYSITDSSAKKDLARAEKVRGSVAYQRTSNEAAASDLINGLKSTGDHVGLSFGQRIDVSTAMFSKATTAAFTGGVAQLSASASSEKSDDIRLVKTESGYQIQLESKQLKEFGLNSIFGDIATVDVKAGGSASVGYHLDFDSAEKASQFLSAVASGDTAAIQDKSCLGLPSSICMASKRALYGGVSAGLQIAPPIPGVSSALNMGSIGLAVSGERETSLVGNTSSTTSSFAGSFSYSLEVSGELAAIGIAKTAKAMPKSSLSGIAGDVGDTAQESATSQTQDTARAAGIIAGEASMTRAQTVAITKPAGGIIKKYEITDRVACNVFGKKDVGSTNIAGMAVNRTLNGIGGDNDSLETRLDIITGGNKDQKAEVLALLAKAEPGQEISISRELETESLFEINNLLSQIDDKGQTKSKEQLRQDKSAADKIINDPKAYVITAFSLTTVAKEADNSRVNVIEGQETTATGIVDVTNTARGAHVTLETVMIR